MTFHRFRMPSLALACTGLAATWLALSGGEVRAQDPSGVTSEIERTASTTPQEKIAYGEAANETITDAEKQITRLLEQARKDNDAEAIECLINRLTSVRALLQVSTQSQVLMRDAIAAGLSDSADHEFRKIAVAVSKTRMLLAEAQRCATDQQVEPGQTLVDWESALADEGDLGDVALTDFDLGLDPPEVSPFL